MLQEELSETRTELEKSRNLSATLENDLLQVQHEAAKSMHSSAVFGADAYAVRQSQASGHGSGTFKASPTSSFISGVGQANGPQNPLESVPGGAGILPMVTAQRDRFKQRSAQLEEELSKTYSTVTSLRQEIAALQKDNLALYEKTRYASSFNRGPAATTSSSSGYHQSVDSNANTSPGASVDRYRSAYEASISPFAAFRARESARAYRRMSMPERAVYAVARMVLATRTSRNLFAAYCLALHVLAFVLLYWLGTANIERHTSKLGEAAAGPLAAAAAAAGGHAGAKKGWHPQKLNDR
jgi:homeobox protein cut-like